MFSNVSVALPRGQIDGSSLGSEVQHFGVLTAEWPKCDCTILWYPWPNGWSPGGPKLGAKIYGSSQIPAITRLFNRG